MDKTQLLKNAIEFAKKNPDSPQAVELRKRIESGMYTKELAQIKSGVQKPQPAKSPLESFAIGTAKGIAETVKGIGNIGGKIGEKILPGFENVYSEEALNKNAKSGGFMGKLLQESNLETNNTAESLGKGVERVAEFIIPAGKISKASNSVDTLIKGSGLLKSAGRIATKGAIEGIGNAGVTLAQTGGNLKEAGKTALIAGGLKAGLATVGEMANAAKLPERLYSTIFKTSSDDMLQELKTGALDKWQKTNPEEFKNLVNKGIIKVGKDGVVSLNETLAKEALDRGLKGSLKNMATESVKNIYRNEAKAQELVKNYKGSITGKDIVIDLPETNKLTSLLDEISTDYQNVGGNIADDALNLSNKIKENNVNAETALELRRFLDGMRVRSSFNPGQKLSQTQQNFKYFSDEVRKSLTKIPGMKAIMNEYRFNIEALETIAKEAAKQGNTQLLSLIDSMLLSGGLISSNLGLSLGALVGRRALKNAPVLTGAANKIQTIGKSSVAGTATRGAVSRLTEGINQ